MSLQKRLNELHEEIIAALCSINEFPDGLLPHTVYVEEEGENSMTIGNTVFIKEDKPVKKVLYAFLYPFKHFDRNVTDNEILSGWEDDDKGVEKLTPGELAARINDEWLDDTNFWVRFIEVED
jgi:hypothetical protein